MKAGLITHDTELESVQKIFRCMQRYSDAKLIDVNKLRIAAIPKKWNIFYPKFRLSELDAVLFRGCTESPTLLDFRLILSEHMEKMGTMVFNGSRATRICKNKFSVIQFLQEAGIPTPKTRLALNPRAAIKSIKSMKKPVVIKLLLGSHGKGVMKVSSNAEASSIMDTLNKLGQMIYFQEYIETEGRDIRVFVIGNRAVAAMERQGARGEFRSNITAGGRGSKASISPEIESLALRAARAVGADICGVDVILDGKPRVIEVNINPGLKIAGVTGIDIPDLIARHVCGIGRGGSKLFKSPIDSKNRAMKRTLQNEVPTACDFRSSSRAPFILTGN